MSICTVIILISSWFSLLIVPDITCDRAGSYFFAINDRKDQLLKVRDLSAARAACYAGGGEVADTTNAFTRCRKPLADFLSGIGLSSWRIHHWGHMKDPVDPTIILCRS